jgi:hypothetical protein
MSPVLRDMQSLLLGRHLLCRLTAMKLVECSSDMNRVGGMASAGGASPAFAVGRAPGSDAGQHQYQATAWYVFLCQVGS